MCDFCLGARCVRSRRSYGLKQGIPWNFFFLFILILCIPVHEKHKRFLVREHAVSAHGAATALKRESLGIFCFSLFILILCLPVHENHKHFLVWEHVVSAHGAAKALNREFLGLFLFLFVYIKFRSSCS